MNQSREQDINQHLENRRQSIALINRQDIEQDLRRGVDMHQRDNSRQYGRGTETQSWRYDESRSRKRDDAPTRAQIGMTMHMSQDDTSRLDGVEPYKRRHDQVENRGSFSRNREEDWQRRVQPHDRHLHHQQVGLQHTPSTGRRTMEEIYRQAREQDSRRHHEHYREMRMRAEEVERRHQANYQRLEDEKQDMRRISDEALSLQHGDMRRNADIHKNVVKDLERRYKDKHDQVEIQRMQTNQYKHAIDNLRRENEDARMQEDQIRIHNAAKAATAYMKEHVKEELRKKRLIFSQKSKIPRFSGADTGQVHTPGDKNPAIVAQKHPASANGGSAALASLPGTPIQPAYQIGEKAATSSEQKALDSTRQKAVDSAGKKAVDTTGKKA
ncbi:hypothetical protein T484DRAFT_1757301, partial [Baffinella frigidus]